MCLPACGFLTPCTCACLLPCSPAGTYSAEGDETCTACPVGQYNPLEGLADQTSITGIPCVLCAEGSMPMSDEGLTAGVATPATERSTFCDAW